MREERERERERERAGGEAGASCGDCEVEGLHDTRMSSVKIAFRLLHIFFFEQGRRSPTGAGGLVAAGTWMLVAAACSAASRSQRSNAMRAMNASRSATLEAHEWGQGVAGKV